MAAQETSSRTWLMIAAAAFALRLAAAWATDAFQHPHLFEHEVIARALVAGQGFVYPFHGILYHSFDAPLYPWICALVYLLTGGSTSALLLVQMASGAATVVVVGRIGERIWNRTAGIVAAWLVACHPGLIIYASLKAHPLVFDVLAFAFLCWRCIRLYDTRTLSQSLWCGIALGVSMLQRQTAVIFLPAALIWLWWTAPKERRGAELRRAAVIALCAAVILAPWLIRGAVVHRRFVFIRTTFWEVVWRGNNPLATGHSYIDGTQTVFDSLPPADLAELHALPDELQQSDWFRNRALAFVRDQPGAALGLTLKKLHQFWWFAPQSGVLYPRGWLRAYQAWYAAALTFALLGLWQIAARGTTDQRRIAAFLGLMMGALSFLQSLSYVEGRHRWQIEPLLLLFTAVGAVELVRRATPAAAARRRPAVRVLRIITRMNIGGPAVHVSLLSTRLDPERFATTVAAGLPEAGEGDLSELVEHAGVRLVRLGTLRRPLRPLGDAAALWQLIRLVWTVRPHIIHTHTAKAGALGRAAGLLYNALGPGRRPGARAVLMHTFHGHVLEGYFSPAMTRLFVRIERWLARRTDCLIAVSRSVRDELLQLGIGRPERWQVIPLGLDLAALSQLPLSDGAPVMRAGLIGRLAPVKNPALFLQALRRAAQDTSGRRIQGLVVGDGPLRGRLEREARQLGLDGLVQFTGWRRDLREVYAGIDIACLTSWNEGTPVALIEAMAAGRPVVATAVGGVRDLLEDEPGQGGPIAAGEIRLTPRGMLVAPGDADALASAVQRMASDEDLRRRLGQAGRAFVTQRFDYNRLVGDMMALYDRVEAGRNS